MRPGNRPLTSAVPNSAHRCCYRIRFGGEDALAEFCGVEVVEGGGACFAVFEGGE